MQCILNIWCKKGKMIMAKRPNPGYEKAYQFALMVIRTCESLNAERRDYVLIRQLLRSGTSIGANLAEAEAAISGADLSSKISIAYKECQETKYWIRLLCDADYLSPDQAGSLFDAADEIGRILFAAIRTLRIDPQKAGATSKKPLPAD
jgi:four helix bundle protein